MIEEILLLKEKYEEAKLYNKLSLYEPYPYQLKFHQSLDDLSNQARQRCLMAGNKVGKCVSYNTLIETPNGLKKAGELQEGDDVYSCCPQTQQRVIAKIGKKIIKSPEPLWRVHLSNGKWFECADHHRFLTSSGNWIFFSWVRTFAEILQHSIEESSLSGLPVDVQRWMQRVRGFLADCLGVDHFDDGPLLWGSDSVPAFAPLSDDVQQRSQKPGHSGDQGDRGGDSLCSSEPRLSSENGSYQNVGLLAEWLENIRDSDGKRYLPRLQGVLQLLGEATDLPQLTALVEEGLVPIFSLASPDHPEGVDIIGYEPTGVEDLYDFWIPDYQCYLAAGVVHHNTFCGAAELAYHLTGLYPEWWQGWRFKRPITAWAAGQSHYATRDIVQQELLGPPGDLEAQGSAAIPKHLILGTERNPGVPNGLGMVQVQHVSGGKSRCMFKSYDSGPTAWMGVAVDVIWLDEEPPQEIYSQALRASLKTGGPVYLTFTPERGVTGVVQNFLNDRKPGQALVTATWDDAPHLSPKVKEEILAALPPHERQMRSKGIPVLGSGQVFPIAEDSFSVDAFPIPDHWARIAGIDFGFDHPTAVVWCAWDRDTDTVYVYDCYTQSGVGILQHAEAIKLRGNWIPVAWPHDGSQHDKGSGQALAEQYRRAGVHFLGSHFLNPEGGISVEPGIQAMYTRFQTGRLKVFSHLQDWFQEFRIYHRQDGKIIRKNDDLMSASRYAIQSLRYASLNNWRPRQQHAEGSIMEYNPLGHWSRDEHFSPIASSSE